MSNSVHSLWKATSLITFVLVVASVQDRDRGVRRTSNRFPGSLPNKAVAKPALQTRTFVVHRAIERLQRTIHESAIAHPIVLTARLPTLPTGSADPLLLIMRRACVPLEKLLSHPPPRDVLTDSLSAGIGVRNAGASRRETRPSGTSETIMASKAKRLKQ